MKQSRGTVIPSEVRKAVVARDKVCVGMIAGFPEEHRGTLELDHVRASHAIGMKSASTSDNLVLLCAGHHRWKTEHGREARPLLLGYLSSKDDPHAAHVDPCPECPNECEDGTHDFNPWGVANLGASE
jgi:5-methylcytosine-specific restriction endonuclease McrA